MDDHTWSSIPLWAMDDYPNLDGYNILWRDLIHVWSVSIWVSFLVKPYRCDLVMNDHHGRTKFGLDPISVYVYIYIYIYMNSILTP